MLRLFVFAGIIVVMIVVLFVLAREYFFDRFAKQLATSWSKPSLVSAVNETSYPKSSADAARMAKKPPAIEPIRYGSDEEFSVWLDRELKKYEPEKPLPSPETHSPEDIKEFLETMRQHNEFLKKLMESMEKDNKHRDIVHNRLSERWRTLQ